MSVSSSSRVAFLGLGTMGAPMATNLLKAGFPLTVWNRTASKTDPLARLGARVAKSPTHAGAEADVVITMVSAPKDVEHIILGPDGALEGMKSGSALVDMSTVSPATSRKLAGAAAARGVEFLDAPVVGSKGPATDGTLVILVGGLPQTLQRVRPILAVMGKTVIHAGNVGMGSTLKLATNLMLAHLMVGFAEGVHLLQGAGADPQKYLEVLEASTFRSPWYQTKGASVINGDVSPHFALKHMRKDAQLMCGLAEELGRSLPVTNAVTALFIDAERAGKGELDYSAIMAYLLERAGAAVAPSPTISVR